MRSYPVNKNKIGLADSEILRYKQKHRQTEDILLLYYKDCTWIYVDRFIIILWVFLILIIHGVIINFISIILRLYILYNNKGSFC